MSNQAVLSISTSGDNLNVIAAPGGNKIIQVWGMVAIAAGTVSMIVNSGSTPLTGAMPLSANNGFSAWTGQGQPIFECGANEALNINLSAAILVAGWIVYSIKGS